LATYEKMRKAACKPHWPNATTHKNMLCAGLPDKKLDEFKKSIKKELGALSHTPTPTMIIR